MRVLHLFSNHRWTGPAEPALNLCVALRAHGVEVDFACSAGPDLDQNKIVSTARDRGIEPILKFRLYKRRNPFWNWLDRRALYRYLRAHPCDLIHCHMNNDHEIALRPAQRLGIPIVRSSYEGAGFQIRGRMDRLLAGTRTLIEPSSLALEHDLDTFEFPKEHVRVIPNAVDVHRFDPTRELPDGRRRLKIPPSAFVLGIVARLQVHRHYIDLFEAFHQLVQDFPDVHLIVIGRGTKQAEVAFAPVSERGLDAHVHFPGYLDGEDYAGMLRAFDAGVYLVPGTDGTCRAAREILAMGRPVVASDRGMLREIVANGETGLVTDGSPDALYQAFRRLHESRTERTRLGQAARAAAVAHYSLEAQSAAVLAAYRDTLGLAHPETPR